MNVMGSNLQVEALCSIIHRKIYKTIIDKRKEIINKRMKITEYILKNHSVLTKKEEINMVKIT